MIRRAIVQGLLDRWKWGTGIADAFSAVDRAVIRPKAVRSFLHGTWLGHALHPLLTDVPVGALTVGLVLDVLGSYDGANWATLIGAAGMVAAALAGLVDLDETDGKARQYGGVHATLMVVSLGAYVVSLLIRYGITPASTSAATLFAALGYLFLTFGAYVGGELVFGLGNMVDRHAWRSGGGKWAALDVSEVPERTPVKAKAGAQSLVLVRLGDHITALHDTCSHAGCSLAEGSVDGEAIVCPCHGSRFALRDGRVLAGPATFDQPAFEVRQNEGKLEARRVR
jgi:nitrite reductase/ring-hydroxylating ferredoxin subunit/uncharacterized membrane protein